MPKVAAMAFKTIEERYQWVLRSRRRSEIRLHLPFMKELATGLHSVTEFGVKSGQSTTAFLAAQPDFLTSVDLSETPVVRELKELQGATAFTFIEGDSRKVEIEPTDLLFIDSTHTAAHLEEELTRHAGKVRKYLVFHDTVSAGKVGFWYRSDYGMSKHGKGVSWLDKGAKQHTRGILETIGLFQLANQEWRTKFDFKENNGLLVLGRE